MRDKGETRMKKFIIAFSLACASAYVFGRPEFSKTPWFDASATSGTDVTNGGNWSPSTAAPSVADQKYVISTDPSSPITFVTTNESSGDYAETTFNLVTTIVPAAGRVALTGGTVAFVASEDNDAKAYYAWLGAGTGFGWKKLAGATPPEEEGTPYTLVVTFDTWTSGQRRVQFKVGDQVLYLADDETHAPWITYDGTRLSGTKFAINFAGDGAVASFEGKQLNITAEIIDESGGTIRIPKADVLKFNIPAGTDKETYFEAKAATHSQFTGFKSDISVAAAYVLGLIAEDSSTQKMAAVDDGELRARPDAEANESAGVVVKLNVVPKPATDKPETDTGVTITFSLYKGGTPITGGITATAGVKPSFVIPTDEIAAGNQAFKIVAKITPKASAQ